MGITNYLPISIRQIRILPHEAARLDNNMFPIHFELVRLSVRLLSLYHTQNQSIRLLKEPRRLLAKVEQRMEAYPLQRLLSNIPDLMNIFYDFDCWTQIRHNLDVTYNQAHLTLRMILLVLILLSC